MLQLSQFYFTAIGSPKAEKITVRLAELAELMAPLPAGH